MKKFITLILLLVSVFTLTACSLFGPGAPKKETCEDLVVNYLKKSFQDDIDNNRLGENPSFELVSINGFAYSELCVYYNYTYNLTSDGTTETRTDKGYVAHKAFKYTVYYPALDKTNVNEPEVGDYVYYGNILSKSGDKIIAGKATSGDPTFKDLETDGLATKLSEALSGLNK